MIPENYLIFLQIILFMFITPGAPRVLIMSQSLNYGFGKSLWTAFGDISADFNMNTDLTASFEPILSSIDCLGALSSNQISVKGFKNLEKILQ